MTDYTKKGHKLIVVSNDAKMPIVRCVARVVYGIGGTYQKAEGHVLAEMAVWAPCSVGQVIATLRAWLRIYEDDELLAQVEEVVNGAVDALAPMAASTTPSAAPPKAQGLN